MSAQPDTFGSAPGAPRMTDPATGITYTLGFGAGNPPVPIWTIASTWGVAKARLGVSWADAKAKASTWGAAKGFAA